MNLGTYPIFKHYCTINLMCYLIYFFFVYINLCQAFFSRHIYYDKYYLLNVNDLLFNWPISYSFRTFFKNYLTILFTIFSALSHFFFKQFFITKKSFLFFKIFFPLNYLLLNPLKYYLTNFKCSKSIFEEYCFQL